MKIIEYYEDLKVLKQAIEEDNGVYYTYEEIKNDLFIIRGLNVGYKKQIYIK